MRLAHLVRAVLIALVILDSGLGLVRGADSEQREFVILVDGKEAGTSTITIVRQDDGSAYMKGRVQVRFQQILFPFQLTLESEEWWKNGKLIGVKTLGNENGKRTEVIASLDAKGLRVRVNGQESLVRPDVWTSSYWFLDGRHNQKVPILETDTGKEVLGTLEYQGLQLLTLNNQPTKCYHFKVTGISSPVDLWYDHYHRLVRMEFTEQGHRTIANLISVKR